MKVLSLERYAYAPEATMGRFHLPNNQMLYTCENPFLNNTQDISCIPEGAYKMRRHNGDRHKDTWILIGVPGRSEIVFHIGNDINDTLGCILPGLSARGYKVIDSGLAMDVMRQQLTEPEYILNITQFHPRLH